MPKTRGLVQNMLHTKKPTGPKTSGHEVDFGTFTLEGGQYAPWITKLNKHDGDKGREASLLEVAFSEVARLFIKPGLTPPARIVTNNEEIVAVASEGFNVEIKKLVDKGETCYSFNHNTWEFNEIPKVPGEISKEQREQALKILTDREEKSAASDELLKGIIHLGETKKAVNFLDKMPKDFFATLMEKHNNGDVVVDMESLASILTASYVLEEDDLHKGNIGFYVTDTIEDGITKKKFNFFKIDHDLMFTDSIMSQKDMRIANIFYDKDSFKISTRDLDNFPDLTDSGSHYWPTQKRLMAKGDKAYSSKAEREAFANLKTNAVFNDAKWNYFLKSAVLPVALIEKSLTSHLDPNTEADKISMIKNSMYIRIGKLKNKLVESEQFRNYIATNGIKAFADIKEEISIYAKTINIPDNEKNSLMTELEDNFKLLAYCAKDLNLTQEIQRVYHLKQSILLGSYDFSSKAKPTTDDAHVALDQFRHCRKKNDKDDDAHVFVSACVALDVIKKTGLQKEMKTEVKQLQDAKEGFLSPKNIKSLDDFKAVADKIRASSLPLKQQKNEILAVLKEANLPIEDLRALKKDLQKKEPSSHSLKFINQLSSELWVIRKIFGTYGKTSTRQMMNDEIDAQIQKKCVSQTKSLRQQFKDWKVKSEAEGSPKLSQEESILKTPYT